MGEWSPYSLCSSPPLVDAGPCNAAAGVIFGGFKTESCSCFKRRRQIKMRLKARAKSWQEGKEGEDLFTVRAVPKKLHSLHRNIFNTLNIVWTLKHCYKFQGIALHRMPQLLLWALSGILMTQLILKGPGQHSFKVTDLVRDPKTRNTVVQSGYSEIHLTQIIALYLKSFLFVHLSF